MLKSELKEIEEGFHTLIQSRLEEFGVPLTSSPLLYQGW